MLAGVTKWLLIPVVAALIVGLAASPAAAAAKVPYGNVKLTMQDFGDGPATGTFRYSDHHWHYCRERVCGGFIFEINATVHTKLTRREKIIPAKSWKVYDCPSAGGGYTAVEYHYHGHPAAETIRRGSCDLVELVVVAHRR